jgi:hypothetical protein
MCNQLHSEVSSYASCFGGDVNAFIYEYLNEINLSYGRICCNSSKCYNLSSLLEQVVYEPHSFGEVKLMSTAEKFSYPSISYKESSKAPHLVEFLHHIHSLQMVFSRLVVWPVTLEFY